MSEIAAATDASPQAIPRITPSYARYVFFVMFAISFLNYLDRYMLSGSINVMSKELHFSIEGVGYISSAFLIVYTIAALPLGLWADRSKRKNVVAVCVTAWSLITVLTALANSFTTLFLTRMLLGIGEAGYFPAGTALMSDYFRRRVRSSVMSWWNIAQVFGILFGTAIGGYVAGLYIGSWRLGFIFTGIPGLLFAWLAWRLREPRRNQADEEAVEDPPVSITPEVETLTENLKIAKGIWPQILSLLQIKSLLVLTVMQIFAFFVIYVSIVFLSTYLQQLDAFGMSSSLAGLYSGGIIALAGMVGTILGGYLANVLNRRFAGARILICGIGFLLAAPTFALTVTVHSLPIFTLVFIVTVILMTFYQGPSTAALTDVVPAPLRATAVCVSLLIAHMLGDAFSPIIVGQLAGSFDPTHGTHFAHNLAGHDLALALLVTCVPALALAGLVGIFGARWMGADVAAAERAALAS